MQVSMLDPLDERIIHALQISPRASWAELAPVLGADPATLARRWGRLQEAGLAWVTCTFADVSAALIDIRCRPQQIDEVIASLIKLPELVTLDHTSGNRDIVATALTPTTQGIWNLVTRRIGVLPGVTQAQSHLVTETLTEGSSWRMRALTLPEQAQIRPERPPRARAPRSVHPDVTAALRAELPRDGRVPVSRIAATHGLSEQRVADGLARMAAMGQLRLRTDVARSATGWPVYTWYYVRCPAKLIPKMATLLRRVPEVRTAFTVASQYNLILAVWLRELAEVSRFEAAMEAAVPGGRILDRSVVFSMSKHMGHHLDAQGRDTHAFTNAFVGTAPSTEL
jgi:DNA-binding Lrp family transcriptional regulator